MLRVLVAAGISTDEGDMELFELNEFTCYFDLNIHYFDISDGESNAEKQMDSYHLPNKPHISGSESTP